MILWGMVGGGGAIMSAVSPSCLEEAISHHVPEMSV